jgi:hypothetical protein
MAGTFGHNRRCGGAACLDPDAAGGGGGGAGVAFAAGAGVGAALAGFATAGVFFLTTIVDVASSSGPAAAVLDVAAVATPTPGLTAAAAPDVPAAAVPDIPANAVPRVPAVAVAILVVPFFSSKLFMALH